MKKGVPTHSLFLFQLFPYLNMTKNITLTFLLALIVVAFFNISSSTGVAFIQQEDRTGAPGSETNCNACHIGGNFNASLAISLLDATNQPVLPFYTPGETYTVNVTVNHTGAAAFGTQLVGLLQNGNNAGTLATKSDNGRVVTLRQKQYGEHNSPSSSNVFQYSWTAPQAGQGPVTFYAAGLASNSDFTTSGDQPTGRIQFVISEAGASGISHPQPSSFLSYPNPFTHEIIIRSEVVTAFSLLDIQGKTWLTGTLQMGENKIETENLPSGVYLIKSDESVQKILKF